MTPAAHTDGRRDRIRAHADRPRGGGQVEAAEHPRPLPPPRLPAHLHRPACGRRLAGEATGGRERARRLDADVGHHRLLQRRAQEAKEELLDAMHSPSTWPERASPRPLPPCLRPDPRRLVRATLALAAPSSAVRRAPQRARALSARAPRRARAAESRAARTVAWSGLAQKDAAHLDQLRFVAVRSCQIGHERFRRLEPRLDSFA